MKRNLALFDFDGTLTVADSFTAFIFSAVSPLRLIFGTIILAPLIAAHKLGIFSSTRMRALIVLIGFRGRRESDLRTLGQSFARRALPGILREETMERLRWHQGRGDVVVVVSASLDVYLSEWCQAHGVELICSQLAVCDGILTGQYRPRDCSGEEKAKRIRERYDCRQFPEIYAYGDTHEDTAMLELATKKFFRGNEVT